jgi:hypothetical protein
MVFLRWQILPKHVVVAYDDEVCALEDIHNGFPFFDIESDGIHLAPARQLPQKLPNLVLLHLHHPV